MDRETFDEFMNDRVVQICLIVMFATLFVLFTVFFYFPNGIKIDFNFDWINFDYIHDIGILLALLIVLNIRRIIGKLISFKHLKQ